MKHNRCRFLWLAGAFLLSVVTTPTGAADAPPVPQQWASMKECVLVTERLRNNLSNVETLETTQILLVVVRLDGSAEVLGLLADETQRKEVEVSGLKALEQELRAGNLKRAIQRLSAAPMRVVDKSGGPLHYIKDLELTLAGIPGSLVRVTRYAPKAGTLELCGVVDSRDHVAALQSLQLALAGVNRFDLDGVVVADQRAFPSEYVWEYTDMLQAMEQRRGDDVVKLATSMIRRGYAQADAWYFRAAGHVLAKQQDSALGDLRIAAALEPSGSYYRSRRFAAFQRFQGCPRMELERIVAYGAVPRVSEN